MSRKIRHEQNQIREQNFGSVCTDPNEKDYADVHMRIFEKFCSCIQLGTECHILWGPKKIIFITRIYLCKVVELFYTGGSSAPLKSTEVLKVSNVLNASNIKCIEYCRMSNSMAKFGNSSSEDEVTV